MLALTNLPIKFIKYKLFLTSLNLANDWDKWLELGRKIIDHAISLFFRYKLYADITSMAMVISLVNKTCRAHRRLYLHNITLL